MEFEPFFVTCVTCGSRLRVNRAELVDSIVACPKCQAMVQLSPSLPEGAAEGAVALGRERVDSEALTEESISRPPDHHAAAVNPSESEPPPVFTEDPVAAGRQRLDASGDPQPPLSAPPPNWQSAKSNKPRQIAITVAVVIGSVISATILFNVIAKRNAKREQQRTQQASATDAGVEQAGETRVPLEPQDNDKAASVAAEGGTAEGGTAGATGDDPSMEIDDAGAGSDAATTDANTETPPGTDPLPPDPGSPAPPTGSEGTGESTTESTGGDALIPTGMLPDDILGGLTPGNGNATEAGTPEGTDEPDVSKLKELPEGLGGIFDSLNLDRPQFEATEPAPKTIKEIEIDRAADAETDLSTGLDKPKPINIRQAMGLSLAFQTAAADGYPLNDLMLVFGQFTGVPFEIEWVSFDIVGTPIDRKVKLPRSWLTVEEFLTEICTEADAEFEPTDTSVIVRPRPEAFESKIDELIDLSDLGDGTAEGVRLARTLLGQTEGNPDQVARPVESGPAQVAALACEAIRRIRGAPGKMSDESFSRWGGPYASQLNAWPVLTGGISGERRYQPSAFAGIARQISRLNGATCYVNWPDGRRIGLSPTESKMPQTGEDVTAGQAMQQVLELEKMRVRVADDRHWWIGTDASFDRFPVVVWLPGLDNPEATSKKIAEVIGAASDDDIAIAGVAVDAEKKTCLCIVPRYLLRQFPRLIGTDRDD